MSTWGLRAGYAIVRIAVPQTGHRQAVPRFRHRVLGLEREGGDEGGLRRRWAGAVWAAKTEKISVRSALTLLPNFGILSGSTISPLAASATGAVEGSRQGRVARANSIRFRGLPHLTMGPRRVSLEGCRQKQLPADTRICSLTSDVS